MPALHYWPGHAAPAFAGMTTFNITIEKLGKTYYIYFTRDNGYYPKESQNELEKNR
jgi:hypothetical protein